MTRRLRFGTGLRARKSAKFLDTPAPSTAWLLAPMAKSLRRAAVANIRSHFRTQPRATESGNSKGTRVLSTAWFLVLMARCLPRQATIGLYDYGTWPKAMNYFPP